MNHQRIFDIACELKPLYDAQEHAFQRLLNENDTIARDADWKASIVAYNDKLMSYAAEIASITGNSTDNIRHVLGNRPFELGATPDFLRNVAQYDSFNSKLWSQYSGYEREPTRIYEFP